MLASLRSLLSMLPAPATIVSVNCPVAASYPFIPDFMRRSAMLLAFLAAACTPSPVTTPAPRPIDGPVTADELRRDLYTFAADSFRGRATGTPDELRGARFIVDRLAALGLEPAGDSGFYQPFPLAIREAFGATRFTVTGPGGSSDIALGADLMPLVSLGAGGPLPAQQVNADIVFAGYGAEVGDRNDLAGLNVEGKTVVVVNGAPAGAAPEIRERLESRQAIGERMGRLVALRPAAIIILLTGAQATQFGEAVPGLMETVMPPGPPPADSLRTLPMILLGTARAGSPLLPAGWPAADRPQALAGRRFSASVTTTRSQVNGYNVVALVRGTDPALAGTYVAYGAHLDHIGIAEPVNGDSIANGADDDGSGTVALLAIAKGYKAAPLERSVLFVWHGGEEEGLLGSAHFTTSPTVPIDSIFAQLNADMIGRNSADSLYIVGPGAAPDGQSRILGVLVDSVNAGMLRPFSFNRTFDSPTHPEQIYFRSDHYNYARRGVPVLFFTTGLHEDYHKVSDEADKIDYEKLARVANLMYRTGEAVARRSARPLPPSPAP